MLLLTYIITFLLLIFSFNISREKTLNALKKAWKAFENILPQFLVVILIVGVMITALDAETISKLIGKKSGWAGTVISSLIGAITLIPGFVAFPTASLLIESGAGYMQIGAFISSLMMVGVVTIPVERKFFGVKATALRNFFAFIFSFVVAAAINGAFSL